MTPLKNEVARVARLAYARGLVFGIGGNISAKADETILITPEGACLRDMTAKQIVTLDLAGKRIGEPKPSIELPMHLAIYREYSSVKAIVHTHSPFATIWSTLGKPLQSKTVEGRIVLGRIPVIGYAEPGTTELAKMVCEKLRKRKAVLLQNHGLVAVGPSLDEAFNIAETVEETAKIEVIAAILKR